MLEIELYNNFFPIVFLGTEFRSAFSAPITLWFGTLLYKKLTSKVTRKVSSVTFSSSLILLMKFAVSLKEDGSASTCGLRQWSKFEILLYGIQLSWRLVFQECFFYIFLVEYDVVALFVVSFCGSCSG